MGVRLVLLFAELALFFVSGKDMVFASDLGSGTGEIGCHQTVPNCEKCLDHRTCQRCRKGFHLIDSYWGALCVASCPEGYVESIVDSRGSVCTSRTGCPTIPKCAQCDETFDKICDRCQEGLLLFQQETGSEVQCLEECPAGFIKHGHVCRPEMCEDFFCSRCKAGWVLEYKGATKCLRKCPSGFYKRNDRWSDRPYCDFCRKNCRACRDSLNCDVCNDGFYLYRGVFSKCAVSCPNGFLVNNSNTSGKTCQRDTAGCLDNRCLQCKKGWFQLRTRRLFSCHKQCPTGYFGIRDAKKPNRCGRCPYNCDQCSSHRDCKRCKPGLFKLARGEREFCLLQCPRGYSQAYDRNGGKVCQRANHQLVSRL